MSNLRKILGILFTLALLGGVGGDIYLSMREQLAEHVKVRGLIGSEKEEFFRDPRVIAALKAQGLEVQVQKAGSRQIATQPNLKEFDFAFPAGAPAAEKIRREQNIAKSFPVFFTPMAVASWKRIAGILEANGIVWKTDGIFYIIDMERLLDLCQRGARWTELRQNDAYKVNKSILVNTTDIRHSNSAAMYLALASFVLNGKNIVASEAEALPLADKLAPLFLRQGYQESSSAGPFSDYLVMGPGKAPLVMIYEGQYLFEAARPDSGVSPDMALLYPEPTLFAKHILIPLNDRGDKLGRVLSESPELQQLAIEHGFRNADTKSFRAYVDGHKLAVPEVLVNVTEAPSYEILESMIQRIEQFETGAAR